MVVVAAEYVTAVVLDVPKKAVPIGTAAGVQLAAVLKSAEPGFSNQVASCADAGRTAEISADDASSSVSSRPLRSRRFATTKPLPAVAMAALAVDRSCP